MPGTTDNTSADAGPLRVEAASARELTLRAATCCARVSVLDRDVFRLRVAPSRRLKNALSWAVLPREWPEPAAAWRNTRNSVTATTPAGRFTMQLSTGRWRLADDDGHDLFSGSGGGFLDGKPAIELRLVPGERLFGLGESSATFDKRGLIREFWNIDVLGHTPAMHPGQRNLYLSIPFAVSLRGGVAAGLFWDNPARQVWDMGSTRFDRWQLAADSGEIDLYLILGPTVARVVGRFNELTGRMPLPPTWALGYHQCRYSYMSRARVEEVARTFRRKRIPCDALYLDIDHMDGKRVFTFGKSFRQPAAMMGKLARQGFKVVCIVDPGVKNDPKFGALKRGRKLDVFVKDRTGKNDLLDKVWPGVSRFPDFLNATARRWWGREQGKLTRLGVAGFWNDMNEPASFSPPSKTLDLRARHRTDRGIRRHADVHNLYGREMARASREGSLAAAPDARPFVITRAGWAGVQQHALVWTGDNSSSWQHFEDSIQMLLNLGMSGVPFCGCDAGGFLDNSTPELFVRWMQCAVFTPFLRGHSNVGTIDHEPWAFGADAEAIIRRYIELRYELLPYLQSLFVEASRTGAPIMRPLLWHHQDDPIAAGIGDQFLLGRDLLVAPITKQGSVARSVYLPAGEWFDFNSGERLQGGRHVIASAPIETIPLFVRAGAVIPFRDAQQFVGEKPLRTATLHVWPGSGSFHWYEDDGISNAHEQGDHCERDLQTSIHKAGGRLVIGVTRGARASTVRKWRIQLHGLEIPVAVKINGGKVKAANSGKKPDVSSWEFANSRAEIEIDWA